MGIPAVVSCHFCVVLSILNRDFWANFGARKNERGWLKRFMLLKAGQAEREDMVLAHVIIMFSLVPGKVIKQGGGSTVTRVVV